MTAPLSVQDAIDALGRDTLRHIVLLKQLLAYPQQVKVHRAAGPAGAATLVAVDASASPYDRQAYPKAAIAAFISTDHPALTASLLPHLPRGVGIVFKLSREADAAAVAAHYPVARRTAFVSFTSTADRWEPCPDVHVTSTPSEAAFELLAGQGHDRAWLEPLLRSSRAFACVAERDGEIVSACVAFDLHRPVWEVGGVVTDPSHRRQGLGTRVVRTALAELAHRGLTPRYQVEEHNTASIRLARSAGLAPFLTIVHHAHAC